MFSNLNHITFAHKWMLWLIPLVLVLGGIWLYYRYKKGYVTLTLSNTSGIAGFSNPIKGHLKLLSPVLRLLSLAFLIVAIARPQTSFDEEKVTTEGIDIVLAMDVSTSMLAKDFSPNRVDAAKKVALDFVDGRPNDRIGLVIFAGESFTQCPVTIDHTIVKNQLKEIKTGILEDGTAIGMGLATAVQRLKDNQSKSKVIILMTDGVNNRGLIDPRTAIDIALQFGMRIYTIGVGTNGTALTPVAMRPDGEFIYDNVEVQIDEPLLRDIAQKTNGKYFRATNNQSLKEIYAQIDKLEKTRIEVSSIEHKTEKFYPFALWAIAFFLLEVFLRYTFLKSIP